MRPVREKDIEAHLVKRVKEAGGEIRKVKWIGRHGAPDRRVMLPNRCCWVELKRPGLEATDNQAREHARMRKQGETVLLLNTIESVDCFIAGLL